MSDHVFLVFDLRTIVTAARPGAQQRSLVFATEHLLRELRMDRDGRAATAGAKVAAVRGLPTENSLPVSSAASAVAAADAVIANVSVLGEQAASRAVAQQM